MKIQRKITAQDSDNLSRYFSEIRTYQPLEKEEERKLIIRIQKHNDTAALTKLVNANVRFVVSVAKKYQSGGVPILDLISEGNAGLIEAAKRFDVSKDIKFFSYAVWWIRIKIFTSFDYNGRMIQLPANRELLVSRIKRAILILEQELERYPSLDELYEYIVRLGKKEKSLKGVSRDDVMEAITYGGVMPSIQDKSPNQDDEENTMEDCLSSDDLQIDSIDKQKSIIDDINRFIFHLNQQEADIIVLSMGLNDEPPLRGEDIAKALDLKLKDIVRLRTKALKRLKTLKNISSLKDYL